MARVFPVYVKIIIIALVFTAIVIVFNFFFKSNINNQKNSKNMIKIQGEAFAEGEDIPSGYTCDGENINPEFKISGVPENAKSLALIVDDPDAPRGTFNHWLVWNIDPKISEMGENSVPKDGVQGENDAGSQKYIGPCPPSGTHRYFFKVFALDTTLNLQPDANRKDLDAAMAGHIIDQGQLMGKYKKVFK